MNAALASIRDWKKHWKFTDPILLNDIVYVII